MRKSVDYRLLVLATLFGVLGGALSTIALPRLAFAQDETPDKIVAHPVEGVGLTISTLKDATGKLMGPELCKTAKRPNGGWVEYMWPKPVKERPAGGLAYAEKPSRKVTYMLGVEGTPYQVGAGEYNDALSVKQLDALLPE